MSNSALNAPAIEVLVEDCVAVSRRISGEAGTPAVVVSPYRFNPLGAHIDHQGGQVLARCINQYTVLCFWPSDTAINTLYASVGGDGWQSVSFHCRELEAEYGWDSMARASAAALNDHSPLSTGMTAVVFGTMISSGLSSSASVILAYISALSSLNDIDLRSEDLVELSRRVENDYRGLNNGIQDQMSIVFGRQNHLTLLDVESVSAQHGKDTSSATDFQFLMCYSGVSRDLAGSGFNTRVSECKQAAALLHNDAIHLGQVPFEKRQEENLNQLPLMLGRRAKHVYTEMARVVEGMHAWTQGEFEKFGRLMNLSCQSSIYDYQRLWWLFVHAG